MNIDRLVDEKVIAGGDAWRLELFLEPLGDEMARGFGGVGDGDRLRKTAGDVRRREFSVESCRTNRLWGRWMRILKTLAIVNMLMCVAVLIGVSLYGGSAGNYVVGNKELVERADKAPGFVAPVLMARIEALESRCVVLTWLGYGSLLVLGVNAFFWAVRTEKLKDTRPSEPVGESHV